MIRKMLYNQTSEFYFDPQHDQAAATIQGFDKNGILRTVHGTAYNVVDELMAFQTLNSFFEEELNMKYDYIVEFGAAEKALDEMSDFIANLPPVNEGN